MLLIVASILAGAVARSRRLVIRQVAAARDRASLARYFAPGTVARPTGGEQMLHEYGASRVAVLFAAVAGLTRLPESAPPPTVVAPLRGLPPRTAPAGVEHQGTPDTFPE